MIHQHLNLSHMLSFFTPISKIYFTSLLSGFISGWESFDTSFLVDTSNRIRAECDKEELHGNCTGPLWVAGRVDHLQVAAVATAK